YSYPPCSGRELGVGDNDRLLDSWPWHLRFPLRHFRDAVGADHPAVFRAETSVAHAHPTVGYILSRRHSSDRTLSHLFSHRFFHDLHSGGRLLRAWRTGPATGTDREFCGTAGSSGLRRW